MEVIDPFRDSVFSILDVRTDLHHFMDADHLALELAYADIGFESANIEVLTHCVAEWLNDREKRTPSEKVR